MAKSLTSFIDQQRTFWTNGVLGIGLLFVILCAVAGSYKEKEIRKFLGAEHFVPCGGGVCSL
jgi:hypothetical protein